MILILQIVNTGIYSLYIVWILFLQERKHQFNMQEVYTKRQTLWKGNYSLGTQRLKCRSISLYITSVFYHYVLFVMIDCTY